MIETLLGYFSYKFVMYAIIVGVLVSLCSSLLGVTLVLRRFSMIGDGLSHVAFGALVIGTVLGSAPLAVAVPVVIAAAFFILRISENSRIGGDAAVAMVSSVSLAVGVIVISVTTGMNTDVTSYMFGSINSMEKSDALLTVLLSSVTTLLYVLFFSRIFSLTFDETFAKATGMRTGIYKFRRYGGDGRCRNARYRRNAYLGTYHFPRDKRDAPDKEFPRDRSLRVCYFRRLLLCRHMRVLPLFAPDGREHSCGKCDMLLDFSGDICYNKKMKSDERHTTEMTDRYKPYPNTENGNENELLPPIKRVAALHYISCLGRCALTVIIPVLSALGLQTVPLPTALLSTHTGGFTDMFFEDLTGQMKKISRHWQDIDVDFDALYSGFLGSDAQIEVVADFTRKFGRHARFCRR